MEMTKDKGERECGFPFVLVDLLRVRLADEGHRRKRIKNVIADSAQEREARFDCGPHPLAPSSALLRLFSTLAANTNECIGAEPG